MLFLTTKDLLVTVDAVQQRVFITRKRLMFKPKEPRIISFEEIKQVYLDYWEDVYTLSDEYISQERARRRWAVLLTLKNGQTVTVGEEISDQRIGEKTLLANQHAHWEALAVRFSELVGKPLTRMPGVPGGPHTFVQAIDYILQRNLRDSGVNNVSVHIMSGMDLGVEIVVNGKSYGRLEDIEDEAVRSLIQVSIREWQESSPY